MAPPGIHVSKTGVIFIVLFTAGSLYYFKTQLSPPPVVDMKLLLIASIDFAQRGGDQVREVMDSKKLNEKSKGKTKEGVDDPLTMGDLKSHQAIVQSFQQSFPEVEVVSEEKDSHKTFDDKLKPAPVFNEEVEKLVKGSSVEVKLSDVLVWVDPLDATKEYTENLLQYVTTMVCVAVKGQPVIGVIHKPFEKKTYWSWVGHGSNIEEKPNSDAKHSIIVSRSHSGDVNQTAHEAFGDDVTVIPAGGAGYKSLALFEGIASAYIHTTLIKKWDICAGNAVLDHAGGKMTTLNGDRIDYSSRRSPKNEGGLLAALHNHALYLSKLQ